MTLKATVKVKIRTLRQQMGLSQQTFAEKTGLSVRYISYLENGDRRGDPNITLDMLEKVANGLGVPPSALLTKDDPLPLEPYPGNGAIQGMNYAIRLLQTVLDSMNRE